MSGFVRALLISCFNLTAINTLLTNILYMVYSLLPIGSESASLTESVVRSPLILMRAILLRPSLYSALRW